MTLSLRSGRAIVPPGPFKGQHTGDLRYSLCPPEWDLSPGEYQRLATPQSPRWLAGGSAAVAATAPTAWPVLLHPGPQQSTLEAMTASMQCLALATVAVALPLTVLALRRDRTRLDHLDPALVVSSRGLPEVVRRVVDHVAHVDLDDLIDARAQTPDERAERLRLAYETTSALNRVIETTGDGSLRNLVRHCPEEVARLAQYALTLPSGRTRQSAAELLAARMQVTPAAVSEVTASETTNLRDLWANSVQTHDLMSEQWGAIIGDPLNALTHSTLFDVTQPRTAMFIETYGHAQDLRAVHGTTYPGTMQAVTEYRTAVGKADRAWAEARRYAEHVGFDWLPPTEADAARRAAGLLALAADESTTFAERATAAARAADLLGKVHSFLLPPSTMQALESQSRHELTAAPIRHDRPAPADADLAST